MPELPCDCNTLSFELSGDGEIAGSLLTKAPGPTMALAAAPPSCRSVPPSAPRGLPACARLIHDVMLGDRSLFTRPDGLHHVWEVAAGLLGRKPDPITYPRGSWGAAEAGALAGESSWILGE
jgi:glucose-6-phosphate 1-dehydrogenase